ncbi:MAG: hypothetical protein CMO81_05430 [Waddliaceae bacterium]|nr:hypothetical protein [Waddliaceae bacterium]
MKVDGDNFDLPIVTEPEFESGNLDGRVVKVLGGENTQEKIKGTVRKVCSVVEQFLLTLLQCLAVTVQLGQVLMAFTAELEPAVS